jgi:hypothetical protein
VDSPIVPVIPVPAPSGKIAFDAFAEDLKTAYRNAPPDSDPWRAVAKRALHLAPITLPEVTG